ncbi:MAG: HAD family phosphatase [Actinomycetaceae bacterium]|nr:HAD family phosphatase [Actinomycetaceae bacterium]
MNMLAIKDFPEAVFFDLDGTVADTEANWFEGEMSVLAPLGVPWTHEVAQRYIGVPVDWSVRDIIQRFDLTIDPDALLDELVSSVHAAAQRRRTQWLPGVLELLELLNTLDIPTALVTMSHRQLADVVIEDCPPHTFQCVVTGEEVERGKPDPQAYIMAAQRLGVDIGSCLVFEDSAPGVLAGIRSGAQVVNIPCRTTVPDYPNLLRRQSMSGIDETVLTSIMSSPYPYEM